MLKVRNSFMATDENGNEVLIMKGDQINEISDAGPVYRFPAGETEAEGWNVAFRVTSPAKQWTEVVTYDAVKLLKTLEG